MWAVTQDEAVEIFARFWSARYGTHASGSARKMAHSLEADGDQGGNAIWTEVADAIERLQQQKRPAHRQETVTARS